MKNEVPSGYILVCEIDISDKKNVRVTDNPAFRDHINTTAGCIDETIEETGQPPEVLRPFQKLARKVSAWKEGQISDSDH